MMPERGRGEREAINRGEYKKIGHPRRIRGYVNSDFQRRTLAGSEVLK